MPQISIFLGHVACNTFFLCKRSMTPLGRYGGLLMIQWSEEQLAIFAAVEDTSTNLIVNASPGSGKTTISQEIWTRLPNKATLQLAFNKTIVEESNKKYPKKANSKIQTFNSLGHGICLKAWPSTKLKSDKLWTYIRECEHAFPELKRKEWAGYLYKAASLCKSNLPVSWYSTRSPEDITDLLEYHDLDTYPKIERDIQKCLLDSLKDTHVIDFADQLLMPVYYGMQFPFYQVCLVDEAQDMNEIQRDMLRCLRERNPKLRLLFVGDSHQAIYAFRGALADSMAALCKEFACTAYPLTLTHRCPYMIVKRAQLVWPNDIQAPEEASVGVLRSSLYTEHAMNRDIKPVYRLYNSLFVRETFKQDDLVLCRTTAPLVAFAYQLLRNGIACQVRGKEIGKSFINYIKKSGCTYVADFLVYAENDLQPQIAAAVALHKDTKAQNLADKLETLTCFAESCQSMYVSDMIRHIEALFDTGRGVLLSTVHKAKGLEADKVYILAPDLMPHPLAKQAWEKEQEKNIEYVAVTRAKHELVFIY